MKDFFTNLCLLVAILFFYSQVSNKYPLHRDSPVKNKILLGVLGGLLANVLMQYSIHVDGVIMDLRHIPTVLLAYFGGAIPASISMILTIIGRFFISTTLASYLAIVISISGTLFAIFLSRSRFSKKIKIITIISFNNIVFTIVFSYLVHNPQLIWRSMLIYWVGSYLSAFLAFYVLSYIRKSQKLFNQYKKESVTDGLTGLNNVRKFEEIFSQIVLDLNKKEQKLSVLYIDIDFFKKVNDTYGHAEGDVVLKELGVRLQEGIRSFDIVSRNGGEEFSVLLLDCPLNRAIEIAERIRKSVEEKPFLLNSGEEILLTISIGVASYQETTDDPELLIIDADGALYEAKRSGRNKVCIAPC